MVKGMPTSRSRPAKGPSRFDRVSNDNREECANVPHLDHDSGVTNGKRNAGAVRPVADNQKLADEVAFLSTCIPNGLRPKTSLLGKAMPESCCARSVANKLECGADRPATK